MMAMTSSTAQAATPSNAELAASLGGEVAVTVRVDALDLVI